VIYVKLFYFKVMWSKVELRRSSCG